MQELVPNGVNQILQSSQLETLIPTPVKLNKQIFIQHFSTGNYMHLFVYK
jgi:hypothetical protein